MAIASFRGWLRGLRVMPAGSRAAPDPERCRSGGAGGGGGVAAGCTGPHGDCQPVTGWAGPSAISPPWAYLAWRSVQNKGIQQEAVHTADVCLTLHLSLETMCSHCLPSPTSLSPEGEHLRAQLILCSHTNTEPVSSKEVWIIRTAVTCLESVL